MKTEELLKVLKNCNNEEADCADCPLDDDEIGCISIVMTAAEEEILRLQSEKAEIEKRLTEAAEHLNDLAAEISRLNGVIALKPKWIPVTERLPEKSDGDYVLVCATCKVTDKIEYRNAVVMAFVCEEGFVDTELDEVLTGVTHWMLLPDAPEEVSKDE